MNFSCSIRYGSLVWLVGCSGLFIGELTSQDLAKTTVKADSDLAKYFQLETKKLSDACLSDIKTLADWQSKKDRLRAQLFEMLGLSPLPQKSELQVKYTGTTEHEEFVVKNLHFQSRPGLYVTGNLYLPKKIEGKLPAVLYVCGHGRVKKNGKSYGNKVHYHHHGSWFARNGFVCLTIDTLQLGEIEGIHHGTYREKMWWWLNRGYTPAGVEAWNCIRSLDFLESLPEVDSQRLGVTGRSGGGAYSWWIAALDERIRCAVPVAGITDLENHVVDGCVEGHCDCMFMVNSYRWDYPLVAALVAPRPLLISNTDSDRIFPLDGVYRTYQKVKKIYELYGKGDQVAFHITAGPHKDTQELRMHAFRWLNHHLKKDDSLIRLPAEKYFMPEQLKVFDKLPTDQINTSIHESFVPIAGIDLPKNGQQWSKTAKLLRHAVINKCFQGFPELSDLQVHVGKTREANGPKTGWCNITQVKFVSQEHVPLSMMFLHHGDLKNLKQVDLMVLGREDSIEFEQLAMGQLKHSKSDLSQRIEGLGSTIAIGDELESQSRAIVFFAPRGVGQNAWNADERFQTQTRRRFYLLGQTADSMRVFDIFRATQVLRAVCGKKPKVNLQAKGTMAINVVYASMLMPDSIHQLDLFHPSTTHRDGPYFLNVRRILDVPQAIAIAAMYSQVNINTAEPDAFEFVHQVAQAVGAKLKAKIGKTTN